MYGLIFILIPIKIIWPENIGSSFICNRLTFVTSIGGTALIQLSLARAIVYLDGTGVK